MKRAFSPIRRMTKKLYSKPTRRNNHSKLAAGGIAAARTITIPPQVWQLGVALPAPPIIERTFIADLPINHYEARRRRRRRQPPPPPPPEECSICMGPLTGNALTLKHMRRGETLDTQRVEAPCGHSEHQVCLGCLRRHATNWSHHSIGPMNHGGVLCPHEGCRAQYLVVDFARVLEQGDQTKLEEMQRRFSRSGAAVCLGCGDTMHFNPERLRDAQAGSVAQRCTRCPRIQCYHCMRAIHSARFAIATNVGMHPCRCQENMVPEPGHFNRWFVAPPSSVGPLARNRELTAEDCVRQLTELCQSEEVHVPCAHCGTRMHRATACMELTHCGIKRCNVCGISGLEHESVLFDHWDGHGVRGCPRWATDPFWQHVIPQNVVRCEEECATRLQRTALTQHTRSIGPPCAKSAACECCTLRFEHFLLEKGIESLQDCRARRPKCCSVCVSPHLTEDSFRMNICKPEQQCLFFFSTTNEWGVPCCVTKRKKKFFF